MDGKLITNIVIGIVLGFLALMALPWLTCGACTVCAGGMAAMDTPSARQAPEPTGRECEAHGVSDCSMCAGGRVSP